MRRRRGSLAGPTGAKRVEGWAKKRVWRAAELPIRVSGGHLLTGCDGRT